VTIAGFLPSTASTAFDLEFFANVACDPSGYGEGELFLGNNERDDGSELHQQLQCYLSRPGSRWPHHHRHRQPTRSAHQ